MKKIYLLIILLLPFSQLSFAQNYFTKTIGGTGLDEITDMAGDTTGNIYTTGYFSSPAASFGNQQLTNTAVYINSSDIFVNKSTATGSSIWSVKAGGRNQDRGKAIAVDKLGNVFVAGTFTDTAQFGNITLLADSGSVDVFICKLDSSGNFLWAKRYGGPRGDVVYDLCVDSRGNAIITGQYKAHANFGAFAATSALDTSGVTFSYDIFILKVSGIGNVKWLKTGSAKYDDRGTAVTVDTLDNIFVVGQFSDTIQFNQTYNNNVFNTGFIMKIDTSGNELVLRKFSASSCIPYSICVNDSNQVLLCGDFTGNLLFFSTPLHQLTNPNSRKVFIAKYDDNLNYIYSKAFGSTKFITGKKISVAHDFSIYVLGEFKCTLSEFSAMYGTGIFNSMGFRDIYIAKFNNAGSLQWPRHVGGPDEETGNGLICDRYNNPVIAGSFDKKMFYPTSSNTNSGLSLNTHVLCADSSYNKYGTLTSFGYGDGFITNIIDTTREPLDYYLRRDDTTCLRSRLKPCITFENYIDTLYFMGSCVPDTVKACDNVSFSLNFKTGNPRRYSPKYDWSWNIGGSDTIVSIDTTSQLILSTSTKDGCYVNKDTVMVIVNYSPDPPLLTDSYGANNQSPPPTNTLAFCSLTPATFIVTATGIGSNTLTWNGPNGVGNIYNAFNESGVTATLTDTNGCSSNNFIAFQIDNTLPMVNVASLEPFLFTVCKGTPFRYYFTALQGTTPFSSFSYTSAPSVNGDSTNYLWDTNISNNFYTDINPDTTGNYTFDFTFSSTNLCGTDTQHLIISHFIKVNPALEITSNALTEFSCHEQMVTLSANNGYVPTWYDLSLSDTLPASNSILVNGYGAFAGQLHMQIYASDYSQTCEDIVHFVGYPSPDLAALPTDATICPGDSVRMTISIRNGISYKWYGPLGLLTQFTDTFAYAITPGQYYCVATNSDSCDITSQTLMVTPYNTPYLLASPNSTICYGAPVDLNVICSNNSLVVWDSPLSGGGTTRNITQPGTYSCSATSCGIVTNCSMTVLGSSQNIGLSIAGPDTVETCNEQPVVLTANALVPVNYVWSNGTPSQSLNIVGDGDYYVTAYDSFGCSESTDEVHVIIHPIYPSLQVTTSDVCYQSTATLYSDSLYTIHWYSNPTGSQLIGTGYFVNINNVIRDTIIYARLLEDPYCPTPIVPVHILLSPDAAAPNIYGDTVMCNLNPVTLWTDSSLFTTYHWQEPGSITSNASLINTNTVGNYILNVTRNGCNSKPQHVHITNISTPTPTLTSGSALCTGDSILLTAQVPLPNVGWHYINNNGILQTGSTINIAPVQLADSGTYRFFYSYLGCNSDTLSADVTVNVTNPAPQLTSDTVCYKATALLFADSTFSISWFGDLNGTQLIGSSNNIHINNVTTAMTVYAQATGICPSTFVETHIAISPAADAPIIYGDSVTCNLNPIGLYSDTTGNPLYYWLGPNNFSSNDSIVNVSASGVYSLSVDRNNCLSLPRYISLSNTDAPMPTLTGDTLLCIDDPLLLNASSPLPNLGWFNINSNGLINNNSTINIGSAQFPDSGYYKFYYIYLGCTSDTLVTNVHVNSVPLVTLDSALTVCSGQPISINPIHSITNSLYWNFPDGTMQQTGPLNFANADTTMNGIYSFHAGYFGCFNDTSKIRLKVNYVPAPLITSNFNVCQDDTILLQIQNDSPNTTYSWIGNNNSQFNTTGDTTFLNGNLKNVTYKITALSLGCISDTSTVTIKVQNIPTTINIYNDLPACFGDTIKLWTDTSTIYSHHWSGPQNFSSNSDTIILYSANNIEGNYSIYPESSFGCRGISSTQSINVNQLPYVTLGNDTSICDYTPFTLQTAEQYNSYSWNTTETTQQILIDTTNTFWVRVTDDNGCVNTDTVAVNVLHCNLHLRNVMTPDENGLNDMFFEGGEDLIQFHLQVYNRWGVRVFETFKAGNKWYCNCDAGTYYYVIEATDVNDKKGNWTGYINLFK